MMPIEDAIERAERRDQARADAMSTSLDRLTTWRKRRDAWGMAKDVADRGALLIGGIGIGTSVYDHPWVALSAIAAMLYAIGWWIHVGPWWHWKQSVEDEEARFEAYRKERYR